jgi:hypothetical protein
MFTEFPDEGIRIPNHNQTVVRPAPTVRPQHNQTVVRPRRMTANHNQTLQTAR